MQRNKLLVNKEVEEEEQKHWKQDDLQGRLQYLRRGAEAESCKCHLDLSDQQRLSCVRGTHLCSEILYCQTVLGSNLLHVTKLHNLIN